MVQNKKARPIEGGRVEAFLFSGRILDDVLNVCIEFKNDSKSFLLKIPF